MTNEINIDQKLIQIPATVSELLDTGEAKGVPEDLNTERLIQVAKRLGSTGLTVEVIASVGLIASEESAQAITSELHYHESQEAQTDSRAENLNMALKRREFAEIAVSTAFDIYSKDFVKDKISSSGRIIPERDTDKINDLFDLTEAFDEHPVISVLDHLRGKLNAEGELKRIEALAITRLLFTDQVKVIPSQISSAA